MDEVKDYEGKVSRRVFVIYNRPLANRDCRRNSLRAAS